MQMKTAEVIKSLKSLALFGAYDAGYAKAAARGSAAARAHVPLMSGTCTLLA